MIMPKDCTGRQVELGDKVQGEGFIIFQDGFKIDRTPVVTVRENEGVLYFGGLSAMSFPTFKIVSPPKTESMNNEEMKKELIVITQLKSN